MDIAYAPFIERFQTFWLEVKNYDITKGRPKLDLWIKVWPRSLLAHSTNQRTTALYVVYLVHMFGSVNTLVDKYIILVVFLIGIRHLLIISMTSF